jgi:hypothetical protein
MVIVCRLRSMIRTAPTAARALIFYRVGRRVGLRPGALDAHVLLRLVARSTRALSEGW